jgi:integrase
MKLTATQVKASQPKEKPYKLADGKGLYLLVQPSGARYWRWKYRFGGKEKTLALGVYPEASLAAARAGCEQARRQLAEGRDPSQIKRIKKLADRHQGENTFKAVALEWYATQMRDKSDSHRDRTKRLLENDLYPSLGHRPISQIEPPELLMVLRKIEARGAVDMAHRAKQTAGLVFRFGVATGRCERDPSTDLKGALASRKKKHHAAITEPTAVGRLLVAIDDYSGGPAVKAALHLSALLFQRPIEIRSMEWDELNWDEARWEIPAEKMKMRQPHIVPLSRQALEHIRNMQPYRRGKFVFASQRGASRPLSENGVRTALRTMGYTNAQMTPHGFRAMARTILDEVLGVRVDLIEAQLAHAVKDANGRAYNRTAHLPARAQMMQEWADYLDDLRKQAKSSNAVTLSVAQ